MSEESISKGMNNGGDINTKETNTGGDINNKEMNTGGDSNSKETTTGGDSNNKEMNISGDINRIFAEQFPIKQGDVNLYSPLVLAYAGDAVYELYIRTLLLSQGNAPVHKLHKRSISYVKAKAQSDIIHRLMDLLTAEEQDIVRRGRNAKSGTIPKNADVTEYKYATGFEALIGYLYLKGEYSRLLDVLKMSVKQGQDGI